ncbi:MAG TPA: hypothetical protein VK324_13300 [Tepidisphaeraceae bacterium]|nr:hypothetical protein [Tepidisphaeraceae bacterium]
MRKQSKLTLTTAALALSGMAWVGVGLPSYVHAEERAMTAASTVSQGEITQARQAVAKATNAVLNKDWNNLTSALSDNDRQRIQSQWSNVNTSDLDARIDRIAQAWKQKYGTDFQISDPNVALTGFHLAPAGSSSAMANPDRTTAGEPTASGTAFNPAAGSTSDSARTASGQVSAQPTGGLTSDPNRSQDTSAAAGFKESDPTNPDSPMVKESTPSKPLQARTDDSTPHDTNTQASNKTVYGTPGNDANRAGASASANESSRMNASSDATAQTASGQASARPSGGSSDQSPAVTGTMGTHDTAGQRGLPGGDRAFDPNTPSDRMTTLGDRTGNAQDRNQNTAAAPGTLGTRDTIGQRGNPDANRAFDPAANARRDDDGSTASGSASVGGASASASVGANADQNENAVDGSRTNVATGSFADQQGTADRIGGRDRPAPSVDVTGAAAHNNSANAQTAREDLARSAGEGTGGDMSAATGGAAGLDGARTAGYGNTGSQQRAVLLAPAADAQQQPAEVALIRDGASSGFRLDVPDSVDAQRLHDNLARNLDQVAQMQAQWPSDVNEAYRNVSRQVVAALYDTGNNSHR